MKYTPFAAHKFGLGETIDEDFVIDLLGHGWNKSKTYSQNGDESHGSNSKTAGILNLSVEEICPRTDDLKLFLLNRGTKKPNSEQISLTPSPFSAFS